MPKRESRGQRLVLRLIEGQSYITLFSNAAEPVLYRAAGFFELELTEGNGAQTCEVPVASLRATRIGLPGTAPPRLAFRTALGRAGSGRVDRETGATELNVELEMSYPALEGLGASPGVDGIPLIMPFVPVRLDLRTQPTAVPQNGSATIVVPAMSPHYDGRVVLDFDFACEIDDAPKCLELCVRVWVANDRNRQALLTREKVDAILAEANRIWGCNNGQCCIRFKMVEGPTYPTIVGDEILLRKNNEQDSAAAIGVLRRSRGHKSAKCRDIYFLHAVKTNSAMLDEYGSLGVTLNDAGSSIIQTVSATTNAVYSDAALGSTVAHELGHSMGLSQRTEDSADGVSGHSTKPDNLMHRSADPTLPADEIRANTKLNKKQCDRARADDRLRAVPDTCTARPLEAAPV